MKEAVEMEGKLRAAYERIFSEQQNRPDWAFRKENNLDELVRCPIPFVGKKYAEQKVKFLVYASAENLNPKNYKKDDYEKLNDDEFAINRHRLYFDSPCNDNRFFPKVHCEPLTNGALAIAAYYVYLGIVGGDKLTPREFYERISFGNFGKFAYDTARLEGKRKNSDYAGDPDKLNYSLEYVKADIECLKPDYLIMVKTTYDVLKREMETLLPANRIIGIYQMNPSSVNCNIKAERRGNRIVPVDELDDRIKQWYEELSEDSFTGDNKRNYRAVFSYLDKLLLRYKN